LRVVVVVVTEEKAEERGIPPESGSKRSSEILPRSRKFLMGADTGAPMAGGGGPPNDLCLKGLIPRFQPPKKKVTGMGNRRQKGKKKTAKKDNGLERGTKEDLNECNRIMGGGPRPPSVVSPRRLGGTQKNKRGY